MDVYDPLSIDLYHAAGKGDLKAVKNLFKQGGKIDKEAFQYALRNKELDCAKFLIENSSLAIDETDAFGHTLLFYAFNSGRTDIMLWCTKKGVDLNHNMSNGERPLVGAVKKRDINMITFLLEQGVEIDFSCGDKTLLEVAQKNNVDSIITSYTENEFLNDKIHINEKYEGIVF